MLSSHTALLNIPTLPRSARICHVVPSFARSLISLGLLTDHGLEILASKDTLSVLQNGRLLLKGQRDPKLRLWTIDLGSAAPPRPTSSSSSTPVSASTAIESSAAQRVAFHHASLGSPPLTTLIEAVRRNFVAIHGFTAESIRRHPPGTLATDKGHLDRVRQGLRSSRHRIPVAHPPAERPPGPGKRRQECTALHMDATGDFPVPARSGHRAILTFVLEDTGYIHLEPIASNSSAHVTKAFKRATDWFSERHIDVDFLFLDNAISLELKSHCRRNGIGFQLCPPGNHRANRAERAIRTVKNHIISTLSAADPSFPLDLFDEILPHVELTINLLRPSSSNGLISAWQSLHGPFDHSAHPLGPPAMKILAYEARDDRGSWGPHGREGWYLGPSLDHYRCHRVWITASRAVRVVDTMSWLLPPSLRPHITPSDEVIASVKDLTAALDRLAVVDGGSAFPRVMGSLASGLRELREFLEPCTADRRPDPHPSHLHPTRTRPHTQPSSPLPAHVTAPAESPCPANNDNPCLICGIEDGTGLLCDMCDSCCHPACIGLSCTPPGDWLCPTCRTGAHGAEQGVRTIAASCLDGTASSADVATLVMQQWITEASRPAVVALSAAVSDRLTFRSALEGSNRGAFLQAHEKEHHNVFDPQADGVPCVEFIPWSALPRGSRPSNCIIVARQKEDSNGTISAKMRVTFNGSQSEYAGPVSAETADIALVKLHWHSIVSRNLHRATADITAFYLGTPLGKEEYMSLRLDQIPPSVIAEQNLAELSHRDKVLCRVNKGIYGLPQAGRLARERLVRHLQTHGFREDPDVPSLFRHARRPIQFVLVVDDFDIGYAEESDLIAFEAALNELYTIKVDRAARKYLGIQTDYDKTSRTMKLSMPRYYDNALRNLGVSRRFPKTTSPMVYTPPSYGQRGSPPATQDATPLASVSEKLFLQRCLGTFLYPARWVDPTLLTALSKLASQQTAPTRRTMENLDRMLQYIAWHSGPSQTIRASEMILMGAADASYLSEARSRSRAGGILWLGDASGEVNAPISCISSIMPHVMASAAEAEYGGLYTLATAAAWARTILTALGHPQPLHPGTPLFVDNDCARAVANRNAKQRRSKAFDMRLHWIRDRVDQGQFQILRCAGTDNPADYLTKILPAHRFCSLRRMFVDPPGGVVGTMLPLPNSLHRSLDTPPVPSSH